MRGEYTLERRLAERTWVTLEVTCQVRGHSSQATVYDISTGGCMLQTCNEMVRSGDKVGLDLHGHAAVTGTIVWTRHRNSGVQFDVPISAQLVSDIVNGTQPPGQLGRPRRKPIPAAPARLSNLFKLANTQWAALTERQRALFALQYTSCVLGTLSGAAIFLLG